MDNYKLIKSETKFEGKIVNVLHDTIILPSGDEAVMEVVTHPGGVGIVPIDKEGNVIMVRQYRHAVGKFELEIPAGKLDKGEEPLICAKRELEEETGFIGNKYRLLTSIYTAIGFCQEILHIYLADCEETGKINPDEDEFITIEKYSVDTLKSMIVKGEISDGKTIVGIFMAYDILKK